MIVPELMADLSKEDQIAVGSSSLRLFNRRLLDRLIVSYEPWRNAWQQHDLEDDSSRRRNVRHSLFSVYLADSLKQQPHRRHFRPFDCV